jgi:hypothetical protein
MLYGIHLIAGAAIGKSVGNWWLASIIAFASHFVLDALPHGDYPLDSFKSRQPLTAAFWRNIKWVVLDLGLAVSIVLLTLGNKMSAKIWLMMLLAWLPDVLVSLAGIFKHNKLLGKHLHFHHQTIHNWKFAKHWFGFVFSAAVLTGLIIWLKI